MKIAIAQINYHIGNFEGNVSKILDAIERARNQGADIVCFGELAVCGYPPRDFLEFGDFIRLSQLALDEIQEHTEGIAVVVGAPTPNPVIEGKDLFNSAYFIADREILHIQHKALLPTYDIFDEYRYFEPARKFDTVSYKGKNIALTICEDIWNIGNENPLYTVCPLDEVISQNPDFIINISASPFNYNHAEARLKVIEANVDRYKIPLFYVNHMGAQTEIIFDGGSTVMSPNRSIYREMPYFKEGIEVFDLDDVMKGEKHNEQPKNKILEIHNALVLGIRDYFQKLNIPNAIIGLSGGIDSAVTTCLAVSALGANNVRVVLMPSQFSSEHSVNDSIELASNLGIQFDILPIEPIYHSFMRELNPLFKDLPFGLAEENIQARARGVLLMAISNKFGGIVLNTSNKSEAAVGYGTLYGDMCGGLSVIGDLYKTEVFQLARYMNREKEMIPNHILVKPPSAELRPDQKDSDSLPPYDVLDKVLFEYIEKRRSPQQILNMGYEEELVRKILRLVNINEFKRYQTAPVLRVSSKSFGMGRRMPIVGKYLS
jgi:NAD+ synthase (glutamine-hydrolysing)